MIVSKNKILQAYQETYAPGRDNVSRFAEVAITLGVDVGVVAAIVAESLA